MHRTLHSFHQAASAAEPGTVVVHGAFTDPTRGPVRAEAAPLLAAAGGLGERARLSRGFAANDGGESGGVLLGASFVARDGRIGGFALSARKDDRDSMDAAERAFALWLSALRSRRVLIVDAPPECEGCDAIELARADAAAYTERGDDVIVIGDARFPEAGYSVRSAAEVHGPGLDSVDPERVSFVVAPNLPVEEAMRVLTALRFRFPALSGHHFDALCEASSEHAEALASMERSSDVVLVAGEPIASMADIPFPALVGATTIGVTSTPPAPTGLVEEIVTALSGLGPLSCRRRSVRTETLDLPADHAHLTVGNVNSAALTRYCRAAE